MKIRGIPLSLVSEEQYIEDGEEWERLTFRISKRNARRIMEHNNILGQSYVTETEGMFVVVVEALVGNALDWLHDDLVTVEELRSSQDQPSPGNWQFNADLPSGVEKAAEKAFRPVWCSAILNLGNEHDWRSLLNSGWYAGLEIGVVSAKDQFGEMRTWEAVLWEAGSIMQNIEGASRWQIHIGGIDN